MAAEDRAQFQQLQSAQLRIDVVQTKSLMQDPSRSHGLDLAGLHVPGQLRQPAADAEPEFRSRRRLAEDEAGGSARRFRTMGGQSLHGSQGVLASSAF